MKRATTCRRSRTDFARLRTLDDSTIVRDRDAPQWTPEMFAKAVARHGLKPLPKKALLSLRIDSDVIAWFRSQGAGYQSRMNASWPCRVKSSQAVAPYRGTVAPVESAKLLERLAWPAPVPSSPMCGR